MLRRIAAVTVSLLLAGGSPAGAEDGVPSPAIVDASRDLVRASGTGEHFRAFAKRLDAVLRETAKAPAMDGCGRQRDVSFIQKVSDYLALTEMSEYVRDLSGDDMKAATAFFDSAPGSHFREMVRTVAEADVTEGLIPVTMYNEKDIVFPGEELIFKNRPVRPGHIESALAKLSSEDSAKAKSFIESDRGHDFLGAEKLMFYRFARQEYMMSFTLLFGVENKRTCQ